MALCYEYLFRKEPCQGTEKEFARGSRFHVELITCAVVVEARSAPCDPSNQRLETTTALFGLVLC